MDVHLLRIMMATNIPNSKPIEFTRGMLYHPEYKQLSGSGTYPYITDEVDYSETKIDGLTYPEIVDTFFNRKKFINMVSNARSKSDNNGKLDKQKTLERNVMTMLLLLFPTKYFTVNNHKQSIELLEPGIATHYKRSIFYNPLKTISSYVKINGKPYTVTEMIWLNDLLNHPTYRTLVEEVYNLNRSLNTYKTELSGKIAKFKENINGIIDKIYNMISDAITRPKPSGAADKKAAGYASKTNYDALFAIQYLKQLLNNNNNVTAAAVNAEVKKIAISTTKEPYANVNYNPLPVLFTELNSAGSESDQNNRLNQILNTMKKQTAVLSPMLKTNDNIENNISLNKLVDSLFNITLLDEGIKLTNQYNAARNINLSKQSTAQQTDVPIISQFKFNILYKYKRPALTTENIKLQNYIDAEAPEVASEWINKFEQIYNKYILKMKDAKLDTDLLSLNVNNVNMEKSGTSLPTKEIFIKLTLIDGEVNDANKSDIYCPVANNMLGTELLHLIEHRTDNANILNEEDAMFTVNTKTVAIGQTNQKPMVNQINQPDNKQYNLDNKLPPNKPPVVTNEASERFGSTIMKLANQRKLGEIIDKIRTQSAPGIQNTTEGILEFINKTYADSLGKNNDQYAKLPDLPSAINEWSKTFNRNNTKLQDKLTAMNGELDTNAKIIGDKLNSSKLNGNPADRIKLSSQLANIGLYSFIVELLLADEKNKKIVATSKGGKLHKKRRHKTIKCKSKPRYKTHKRRNF